MKRNVIALGAAAALLTCAGCSTSEDATLPTPSATLSSTPEPSVLPLPSTTPSAATSPSRTALSLAESCRDAVADQRGALAQLQDYVKNPLNGGVTVQEVDQARQRLQADAEAAPEPLKAELRTQVSVLAQAVKGIQDKNVKDVDVAAFQAAQARVTGICDAA